MITLTLWGLFSAFLVFPHLHVPRMLTSAVAMLLTLEFLAALTWGLARGTLLGDTAGEAATVDLPALSIVVLALVIGHGLRSRRRELRGRGRPARR